MTIDYQVCLIQFPNKRVRESVVINEDGSYTIFIDASLSHEEQKEEFLHALKHIMNEDFSKDDVQKIEKYAHNIEIAKELCLFNKG